MSPEEKQQKLAELKARLEAAKKELAKRKKQKETGEQAAPGVPPEVEAKAMQYENAANAIMEFDPAMAMKYRQEAEALRTKELERIMALKGLEGDIPADARMIIQQIEKKKGQLANSNMYANASDSDKEKFRERLRQEIAPLFEKLAAIHGGRYVEFTSPLAEDSLLVSQEPEQQQDTGEKDITLNTAGNVTDANIALQKLELPRYSKTQEATQYVNKVRDAVLSNPNLSDKDREQIVANAQAKVDSQPRVPADPADKFLSKLDELDQTIKNRINGFNTAGGMLKSALTEVNTFKSTSDPQTRAQSANAMLPILARVVAGGVLSDGEFDTAAASKITPETVYKTIGIRLFGAGKNVTDAEANAVITRLNRRISDFNIGVGKLSKDIMDNIDPKKEAAGIESIKTKLGSLVHEKLGDIPTVGTPSPAGTPSNTGGGGKHPIGATLVVNGKTFKKGTDGVFREVK
jgi:hypothetical protein